MLVDNLCNHKQRRAFACGRPDYEGANFSYSQKNYKLQIYMAHQAENSLG